MGTFWLMMKAGVMFHDWKHIYDTSIERILSRELVSEGALGML